MRVVRLNTSVPLHIYIVHPWNSGHKLPTEVGILRMCRIPKVETNLLGSICPLSFYEWSYNVFGSPSCRRRSHVDNDGLLLMSRQIQPIAMFVVLHCVTQEPTGS